MTEQTATASDRQRRSCSTAAWAWAGTGRLNPMKSPTSKPRLRPSRQRWTSASRCSTTRTSTGTEKSEAVFGEVLAGTTGLRERIQLQTKCGIRLNERGLETHYDLSARRHHRARERQPRAAAHRLRGRPPAAPPGSPDGPRGGGGRRREADGGRQGAGAGRVQHVRRPDRVPAGQPRDARWWPTSWNSACSSATGWRAPCWSTIPMPADYSFPHGTLEYCARQGITLQAYGALARGHYTGNPPERPTPAESATAALLAEHGPGKGHHRGGGAAGMADEAPGRDRAGHRHAPTRTGSGPAPGPPAWPQTMTRAEWYRLWVTARGQQHPLNPDGPTRLAVVVVLSRSKRR